MLEWYASVEGSGLVSVILEPRATLCKQIYVYFVYCSETTYFSVIQFVE